MSVEKPRDLDIPGAESSDAEIYPEKKPPGERVDEASQCMGDNCDEVSRCMGDNCDDGKNCKGDDGSPSLDKQNARVTRSSLRLSSSGQSKSSVTGQSNSGDFLNSLSSFVSKTVDRLYDERITVELQDSENWAEISAQNSQALSQIRSHKGQFVPPDFLSVKYKLDLVGYTSVDKFSEDMIRIIDLALRDEGENSATVKKANVSVRSVFVKQMEKYFPWFHLNKCKLWNNQSLPANMLPNAVLPPSTDHTYAQWLTRTQSPLVKQPSPYKTVQVPRRMKKIAPLAGLGHRRVGVKQHGGLVDAKRQHEGPDSRQCNLCVDYGDQTPENAGRLLYAGQDDWVHVNCALWSAEVYETVEGSLELLYTAMSRGRSMRCERCGKSGATVGCNTRGCPSNFHFMCARAEQCAFQEDKKVFCRQHLDRVQGQLVTNDKFSVNHRVCINTEGIRTTKKMRALNPAQVNVLFGSCTVEFLGALTSNSDCYDFLLPLDFRCTRVYWSTEDARRRCVYTCQVIEVKPSVTETLAETTIKDTTIAHDPARPDYVPIERLKSPIVSPALKVSVSTKHVTKTTSLSQAQNLTPSSLKSLTLFTNGLNLTGEIPQRSQFGLVCNNSNKTRVVPDSLTSCPRHSALSVSIPSTDPRPTKPHGNRFSDVNLELLSPDTIKQLDLTPSTWSARERETNPMMTKGALDDSEVGVLVKVAERLNDAASKREKPIVAASRSLPNSRSPSRAGEGARSESPGVGASLGGRRVWGMARSRGKI